MLQFKDENLLTGAIPNEIGNMKRLIWFSLSKSVESGNMRLITIRQTLQPYRNGKSYVFWCVVVLMMFPFFFIRPRNTDSNNVTGSLNEVFCSADSNFEEIDATYTGLGYINVDCSGKIPEVACDCCTDCT